MLLQTGEKTSPSPPLSDEPKDPLLSPCEGEARYVLRLAFPLVRRLLSRNCVSAILHSSFNNRVSAIFHFSLFTFHSSLFTKKCNSHSSFFILHSSFNNRVSAIFHFSLFTFHFSLSSLKPAPLPPFQKE